ncbi:MAG: 4-(cytidine 5'-diphospho)-2-C-methyl-D-erythritol kinase, partial [Clostridia bacterium]|nr:4-(cytidine 5'-diphospho)-2-C-methyl-D-erythritol kinase [Clostridia bacterium]
GSADCAATLRALNALWGLHLSDAALMDIGATLGADVPFCLAGGLCRVRGIGERIDRAPAAPEIPLVLVTPGGGLSTVEVFTLWDREGFPDVKLDAPALVNAVADRRFDCIDRLCANALTAPAVRLMPEIGGLINDMRRLGARAAFMTGSGSTVVGAFEDTLTARRAADALPGAVLTRTLPD